MNRQSATVRSFVEILIALALILVVTPAARAQVEEPHLVGLGEVDEGSLLLKTDVPGRYLQAPLLSTDVAIDVTGIVGRAIVKQHFANRTSRCVEGIYAFPLPENAAVDHLRMIVGQRVIEGEIHEKSEAKQIYEDAKREGRRASLLEEQRPNLFTISVANIPAGEEIEVEIEYQQLVRYDGGVFTLRFPMVAAPRYEPPITAEKSSADGDSPFDDDGAPSANEETGPFDAPLPSSAKPPVLLTDEPINPVRLAVTLDAGVALRNIESSTHEIESTMLDADRYAIRLVEPSTPADRDFVLTWSPDLGREPRLALFSDAGSPVGYKGAGDSSVYSLLMVLPPDDSGPFVRLPRETVFVIDTSGSMMGASLDQAKGALLSALDRLRPTDRFNVIQFNSVAEPLFAKSRPADAEAIGRAKQWVGELESTGGTEMMAALKLALADFDPIEHEVRQVIFVTDGLVGNESGLFAYIHDHLGRARLFTVGIGSSPNSNFMTGAARFGRGTFTYIGSPDEVAEKMSALFHKIESPVLTGLHVRIDDPDAEIWPARLPDLYAGEPLVVVARTTRPVSTVSLDGSLAGDRAWSETRSLAGSSTVAHPGVAQLWASKKIEGTLDELTTGGDASGVRDRVLRVALDYHLVSPYTSLVAVDATPAGVDPESCLSEAIPINRPAGMEMFGRLPQTATPSALLVLCGLLIALSGVAIRFVPARAFALARHGGER